MRFEDNYDPAEKYRVVIWEGLKGDDYTCYISRHKKIVMVSEGLYKQLETAPEHVYDNLINKVKVIKTGMLTPRDHRMSHVEIIECLKVLSADRRKPGRVSIGRMMGTELFACPPLPSMVDYFRPPESGDEYE